VKGSNDENCCKMATVEVQRALIRALDQLLAVDLSLVVQDPSERSLTHRLAIHLQPYFPGWDVDCEYNRVDGGLPKRVVMGAPENTSTSSEDAVTVFPDIIVHHRGTRDNLLVIEAKKATSRSSRDFDLEKLDAYRQEPTLEYTHAAFVILPAGSKRTYQVEWR